MIQILKKLMAAFQAKQPDWLKNDGWLNESVAGALGAIAFWFLFYFLFRGLGWRATIWDIAGAAFDIFNLVSMFYEKYIDPNGWDIYDVWQRVPALIVMLISINVLYLLVATRIQF